MPDETRQGDDAPSRDGLPENIVDAIAVSNATSIGEQPAILANLALANQIFNINLAQQNALANQQMVFQIELAALAKCVQVILDSELSEPQAVEKLTARMLEMFDQFHSKAEERLADSRNRMDELLNQLRARTTADKAEGS